MDDESRPRMVGINHVARRIHLDVIDSITGAKPRALARGYAPSLDDSNHRQ